MALKIPDELKADVPQTQWGKILTATPVVMAVVATALAGMASSEMTRAQYDRSLAAQQQSKAGDQWGFFQAKRLRGALQRSTLDLLQSAGQVESLEANTLKEFSRQTPKQSDLLAALDTTAGQRALTALQKGELAQIPAETGPDPKIQAALAAVESSKPEAEIAPLLAPISDQVLAEALRAAVNRAQAFDVATAPVNQAVDRIEKSLLASAAPSALTRDFIAARLRYTALRYDAEARLNQAIASVYELQVRKGNISAERHHTRSQRFFYGMLFAQMGVIISTFAIAARKRSLLWSLAAAAGAAAVSFAIYVYLFI